jgi:ATP-binding cassette subfamily F protein 3
VLLEALKRYSGTVVFVSHDRYFIDNLAARVFEIEDGHVHVYPGNYEDYLWRKSGGASPIVSEEPMHVEPVHVAEGPQEAKKRVNPMKMKKIQDRLREVELKVAELESQIAQHEAALADFRSVEETMRVNDLLSQRRTQLESTVAEWEELSASLEANV